MLETIREYGVERLAESGEIAGVAAAHAAHFLRLAVTAEPYLRGSRQVPWIRTLAAWRLLGDEDAEDLGRVPAPGTGSGADLGRGPAHVGPAHAPEQGVELVWERRG
jgi:hypothetical protein